MHGLRHSPRRAVFLDALGTLIHLHDPWPALRDLLHERHGIEVELEETRRAMRTEMGYYRANCVRAGDRPSLAALRRECAEILRGELAPVLDALDADALEQTLLDALRFDPYEDVVPALRRWRAAGLRLVVVSNWDISLHDVLRQTRLDELLDGVLTSAEVGASKPDPASTVKKHSVETSPDETLKYWTAERMRKAKPAKLPHIKGGDKGKQNPPHTSETRNSD